MARIPLSLCVALLIFSCTNATQEGKEWPEAAKPVLIDYVDPMIGTGGHGHTYPGAALPFGMVQLSPDNGIKGWDWSSGYHYSSNQIIGFSHTHLSGTGVGDMLDVLVMPTTLPIEPSAEKEGATFIKNYLSKFSHDKEQASPGYYAVELDSTQIKVELTVTPRSGFHKYTFPATDSAKVLFDLGWSVNYDKPMQTAIQIVDSQTIQGYRHSAGWAKNQKLYFYAQFSRPFSAHQLIENGAFSENTSKVKAKHTDAAFLFDTQENQELLLKVGISSASIEGAKNNLLTENPDWDFDQVKREAAQVWENQLQQIYRQYGYIPADTLFNTVSKTLEYAFDDWCIAQMAKALGKEADFEKYSQRSLYYRNHFEKFTLDLIV